jgi:hypothetical protein
MFKGTVTFMAKIKGNGLKFPLVEFNPRETGVDKVEIEGPNGDEIHTTVHLICVASQDQGRNPAKKVNTAALNRISFNYNIAIENDRNTGDQFSIVNPEPGIFAVMAADYVISGESVRLVMGVEGVEIKTKLENASFYVRPGSH